MKNPLTKQLRNIRKHTRRYILGRAKNWYDIFGCDNQEMRDHLESLFTDGMNWSNYGRTGWHIDHIKPLSKSGSVEELYNRAHYTNLKPLWAIDNLKKSNK
jgi:hypothetical protein